MRIFLGNLPYNADAQDLQDALAARDYRITDVHIVTDRDSGRSKGYGFAECDDPKVLDLGEFELNGRTVKISPANNPKRGNGTPRYDASRRRETYHDRLDR